MSRYTRIHARAGFKKGIVRGVKLGYLTNEFIQVLMLKSTIDNESSLEQLEMVLVTSDKAAHCI
jgi:hypothetical protein